MRAQANELFEGFQQEQIDLLNGIVSMLPPSRQPATHWHYTTGQGLLAILEDKSLWATQIACLNDASEYGYGSDILFEAFLRKNENPPKDKRFIYLFDKIAKNMAQKTEQPYSLQAQYFVSCFSEDGDDLSQWRGYGGGENGYALGFDTAELNKRQSLYQVFYPKDTAYADTFCERICALYFKGFSKSSPTDPAAWTAAFLWELGWTFLRLSTIIKHPAFESEKEHRQVYEYTIADIDHLRFRQKNSILSRHLRATYPDFKQRTGRDLPLTHIMIGPSRNQRVSERSLDFLLRQKGYTPHVKILCSPAPYREV